MPVQIYAVEKVDLKKDASISVEVGKEGINVSLFEVGSVSEDGSVSLKEEFKKYGISLEDISTGSNQAAAKALETYLIRDKVAPLKTIITDSNGWAVFDSLNVGVYLISYESGKTDNVRKAFNPTLISLPTLINGNHEYDLYANIKHGQSPGMNRCSVYKVWKSADGKIIDAPHEIVVQLLKDGVVFDEKVLNESNAWNYTWEDLDTNSIWTVAEKSVPEGFTVEIEYDGEACAYTITNTEEDKPVIDKDKDKDKLPQTGQLWWPVYILAAAGLFFIFAGKLLNRGRS